MPWLTGTALVHSAIVVEKRESLKIWTVLLAIGTFSLSLSGTFLVRSGILNSVHAFANDPARGIFILSLLGLVIGGSLLLFALRAPRLSSGGVFAPVSREGDGAPEDRTHGPARRADGRFPGAARVEPRAMHAADRATHVGDSGDHRRPCRSTAHDVMTARSIETASAEAERRVGSPVVDAVCSGETKSATGAAA